VARIQQGLSVTFGISGFDTAVALAADTLTGPVFDQILVSPDPNGFGYATVPFLRNFRYRVGDVELAAKYRLLAGTHWAVAVQSLQDSVALAARLGLPTPGSLLDQGTSQRWLRLGFAATYHARNVEGGFSIEQTVSGAGLVPGATVYRLVLRATRKLF